MKFYFYVQGTNAHFPQEVFFGSMEQARGVTDLGKMKLLNDHIKILFDFYIHILYPERKRGVRHQGKGFL